MSNDVLNCIPTVLNRRHVSSPTLYTFYKSCGDRDRHSPLFFFHFNMLQVVICVFLHVQVFAGMSSKCREMSKKMSKMSKMSPECRQNRTSEGSLAPGSADHPFFVFVFRLHQPEFSEGGLLLLQCHGAVVRLRLLHDEHLPQEAEEDGHDALLHHRRQPALVGTRALPSIGRTRKQRRRRPPGRLHLRVSTGRGQCAQCGHFPEGASAAARREVHFVRQLSGRAGR